MKDTVCYLGPCALMLGAACYMISVNQWGLGVALCVCGILEIARTQPPFRNKDPK